MQNQSTENINPCIQCCVDQCKYQQSNHCTLESIQVGTHEQTPTEKRCTDCQSFVLG